VAASKLYRPVPFLARPTVSPICPASGAAYSPAALPVSNRLRPEAVAAEAEVRADPLEEALVELLELDLADLLEADLEARQLQAEHLVEEALAAAEVPADLAARAAVAAVRIPSLILRMAKFPTRWLLARSPTT